MLSIIKMLLKTLLTISNLGLIKQAFSDTCAFCHHTDVVGRWNFSFTEYGVYSPDNVCDPEADITTIGSKVFTFTGRDTVTNENTRSQGHWTLIYDEGFELTIDSQKWWAYFQVSNLPYDGHDPSEKCEYTCNSTMVGVVHDVQGKNWACFKAEKIVEPEVVKSKVMSKQILQKYVSYEENKKIADQLGFQLSEIAEIHSSIKFMPKRKLENPKDFPHPENLIKLAKQRNKAIKSTIPVNFDWDDQGFVSPVKDQGSCGSCYAFASVGMLESRARVITNNQWQPLFSEQDAISCHFELNQGCDGGFAYLTAGKYGQQFGYIEESCFSYRMVFVKCHEARLVLLFFASVCSRF